VTRRPGLFFAAFILVTAAGLTSRLLSIVSTGISGGSLHHLLSAVKMNPTDPASKRRLGVGWIENGDVASGITWLERSLKLNPLSPDTWLELARAHLTDPVQRERHFEQGIAELRTAARLGPGRPELSLVVGMELLRLWPLLDGETQAECRQRLSRGINHMSPEQVDTMIRDWYRYSRSWDLLASVLERCPDACDHVAEYLLELGAPLEWRWRLLDASERRRYAEIRARYNELLRGGLNVLELEILIQRIDRIQGYARLLNPLDMDWIRYRNFREDLLYQAFEQSLRQFRRHARERQRREVSGWVKRVIFETSILDLADLPRRLNDVGLLREDDPQSRILRIHLDLRTGNHAGALERARQLLPTLQGKRFVEVGLLAVRAAIAVRLMTLALQEVEDVLRQDPDNLEALWRRVQVNRFLREDVSQKDLDRLRNEATLEIGGNGKVSAGVPLVEGVRAAVRVPRSAVTENRLLQVYLDGAILLEKYLENEAETVWLDIPFPTEMEPMPNVEAKVLEVKSEK